MTQPLPTAPRPHVLDLELQAVEAVVGGLRAQLQRATQQILALYVSLAGGVDQPLPSHLRRTFADAVSQIIAAVAFTNRATLQALVRQALAMGASDATYAGAAGTAALASQPVRPELEDWVQALVGTLAERVFATLASAKALPQILQPADNKTVMVVISKLNEAGNLAERDTRWAVNAGYNQSFRDTADRQGIPVVWVAEHDACLHCLAYSGEIAQPGVPFPKDLTYYLGPSNERKPLKQPPGLILWGPPLHPNCFPAGVAVAGPPVETAYRRWYSGGLVELRTQSGHVLPVTPNHPILTPEGWVPAGQIQVGAHVLCDNRREPTGSRPDKDDEPALIEQVFRASSVALGVPTVRVPVSAEHFHGDGVDGEVDVVAAGGFLNHWLQVGQPPQQQALVGAGRAGALFASASCLFEQVLWAGAPSDAAAAGHRAGQALLGSLVGRHNSIGGLWPSDLDPGFPQRSFDHRARDAMGFRQAQDAHAGPVLLDHRFEAGGLPASPQVTVGGRTSGARLAAPLGRQRHQTSPSVSDFDPSGNQSGPDRSRRASEVAREAGEALPGGVALDQIVEVHRIPFSGHVYNLQTAGGWYTANGVIVANCRCDLELYLGSEGYPVMPWEREETTVAQALKREAARSVLRGEAGHESQPALVRAASALLSRGTSLPVTVQRRARRAIRRGRFSG